LRRVINLFQASKILYIKTNLFVWYLINVIPRWSHTDLLRLREGRVGAQLWTAYAPCGSQHKDAVQITLEQIDLIKRMVEQYSSYLQLAQTAQGTELYTAGIVNVWWNSIRPTYSLHKLLKVRNCMLQV